MAFDNFIGWSLPELCNMLRGVQEARLTGQAVRVQTAHGVFTEFNVSQTNITQVLRELEHSIVKHPDFDPANPVCAACAANVRPAVTRQSHY